MGTQCRTRRAIAVAFALAGAALAPTPASAAQLVLSASGVTGLHAARASVRSARSDLAGGLSRSAGRSVAHAQIQVSAATGAGQKLRSEAFVFGSSHTAHAVLTAWRRARRARKVSIGRDGALAVQRKRHYTLATLVWREGTEVGVIVVQTPASAASTLAFEYARLQDASLRIPAPSTAYDRVLAQINTDGSVSQQTAMQAFALAYGPLPGVHPPSGPTGDVLSGDLAQQWILQYLPKLSSAQQRVVAQRLGLLGLTGHSARAASGPQAHASCLPCDYGDPTFKPNAALQAEANIWVAEYASHLGALGLQVVVGTAAQTASDYAMASPMIDADGDYGHSPQLPAICRVRMFPRGLAQPAFGQGWILAHEVFHCFQEWLLGSDVWSTHPPAWVTEGEATWAAFAVDPVMFTPAVDKILQYIAAPGLPLFMRSYDAVGFWLHLQDITGGPWAQTYAILHASSATAAFNASGANTGTFFDSWGPSIMRAVPGSVVWGMVAPFALPDFGTLKPGGFTVLPGGGFIDAPPYGTSQYQIRAASGEPVVHVGINPGGDALLSTTHDYGNLTNAWFCYVPGDCVCPPKTEGTVPPTQPLEDNALLGLTGTPGTGTHGEVTSYSLADFCRPKPPPTPPAPPDGGSYGVTDGDPYMTMFSGASYGFQAAGEFTLVKSTRDNLDVQARQQPYPESFGIPADAKDSLALNTAFAMRVADATVEVDTGSPLVLRIDKRRVHPHRGQQILLKGGGLLIYGSSRITVEWPDGSQALVFSIGREGVNLTMNPALARAGHLRGLLGGDQNGLNGGVPNGSGDFIGGNGKQYNAKLIEHVGLYGGGRADAHLLYGEYGNSWRIKQSQSLFVYPRGKSTHSYTIPNYPYHIVSLTSLSPAVQRGAQAACSGARVTNSTLMTGCEIDFGVTGKRLFATSTGALQAGAGIHAHVTPWMALSKQPDTAVSVAPAVATVGGHFLAAYRRAVSGSIETAVFNASATGIASVNEQTSFSGWITGLGGIGDPQLFPAPGGGLQMIFAGLHSATKSDPLNGTLIAQGAAGGTFANPVRSSATITTDASAAVLASDGSTPLWATDQNGNLAVYRGAANAVRNGLDPYSPPGPAWDPALAYDRSGRLWLAWYSLGSNPALDGIYMMQLDPATGASAAPAVAVPSSVTNSGLPERPALACMQICRVVYDEAAGVRSWAPGDSAPTTIFTNANTTVEPHAPTAAYTADGQLWVAFADSGSKNMYAELGDANGALGTLGEIGSPPNAQEALTNASLTSGNKLVLVSDWQAQGSTASTTVWATVVNPG